MKYGSGQYGTFKYGRYIISTDVETKAPSYAKFRLTARNSAYIAQSVTIESLPHRIRAGGACAVCVYANGSCKFIRVRGEKSSQWIIAKGVD